MQMESRAAGAIFCLLLALLVSACASPDLAGPSADPMDRRVEAALRGQDAYVYAMRGPNQSVEEARAKANFFIRMSLQQAFAYKRQGQTEGASFHLATHSGLVAGSKAPAFPRRIAEDTVAATAPEPPDSQP